MFAKTIHKLVVVIIFRDEKLKKQNIYDGYRISWMINTIFITIMTICFFVSYLFSISFFVHNSHHQSEVIACVCGITSIK